MAGWKSASGKGWDLSIDKVKKLVDMSDIKHVNEHVVDNDGESQDECGNYPPLSFFDFS